MPTTPRAGETAPLRAPAPGSQAATAIALLARLGGAACAIAATLWLTHVLFPAASSAGYAALTAIFGLTARYAGREAAYLCVGLCGAAIPYFLLEGEGFAVVDPGDALGLLLFVSAGIAVVALVGGMEARHARAEERCAALEARDARRAALLAELSHRIGNDLGALVSLSELQATKAGHPETRRVVSAIAERIYILGKVYGRLRIVSGRDATLDMRPFLEGLCEDLEVTHLTLRPVSLETDVAAAILPADQAVLTALVLNEAVTNALKHAFPEERAGTIEVAFGPDPATPHGMLLTVRDDGVGFAEPLPRDAGMGQRLMRGMASQIHGSFALTREGGWTVARLRFPIPKAADRELAGPAR